jgi:uncharacterized protein with PIN domain
VYWEGSHVARMRQRVARMLGEEDEPVQENGDRK